jgi:pentatricopeptide repeat protein
VAAAIELLNVEGNAPLYTNLVSAFGRAGSFDDVLSTVALIEGRGRSKHFII